MSDNGYNQFRDSMTPADAVHRLSVNFSDRRYYLDYATEKALEDGKVPDKILFDSATELQLCSWYGEEREYPRIVHQRPGYEYALIDSNGEAFYKNRCLLIVVFAYYEYIAWVSGMTDNNTMDHHGTERNWLDLFEAVKDILAHYPQLKPDMTIPVIYTGGSEDRHDLKHYASASQTPGSHGQHVGQGRD